MKEISKWKKLLGIALTSSMILAGMLMPTSVQASSTWEEVTATETTADFAEDTVYSLLRGNNLNYGNVSIEKISSTEIAVYGLTQCHLACDNVYLELYLEQKDDGSYYTYKSWSFDATDATSLSRTISVIVPSGHYYRVRGYHAAVNGGTKESTSTLTSGVLVN